MFNQQLESEFKKLDPTIVMDGQFDETIRLYNILRRYGPINRDELHVQMRCSCGEISKKMCDHLCELWLTHMSEADVCDRLYRLYRPCQAATMLSNVARPYQTETMLPSIERPQCVIHGPSVQCQTATMLSSIEKPQCNIHERLYQHAKMSRSIIRQMLRCFLVSCTNESLEVIVVRVVAFIARWTIFFFEGCISKNMFYVPTKQCFVVNDVACPGFNVHKLRATNITKLHPFGFSMLKTASIQRYTEARSTFIMRWTGASQPDDRRLNDVRILSNEKQSVIDPMWKSYVMCHSDFIYRHPEMFPMYFGMIL